MRRFGTALHTTVSGQLIVRGTIALPISTPVFTKTNQLIGFVKDVFGPVSYPFTAIVLKQVKDSESLIGSEVYYSPKKIGKKKKSGS